MKINKKIALQLRKQDFCSFKLCTVDKVHAVRTFDPLPRRRPRVSEVGLWKLEPTQKWMPSWSVVDDAF